jgi:hypothetical protein
MMMMDEYLYLMNDGFVVDEQVYVPSWNFVMMANRWLVYVYYQEVKEIVTNPSNLPKQKKRNYFSMNFFLTNLFSLLYI